MTRKVEAMAKVKLPAAGTIEVAPSILSADFARLGEHIGQVAPVVKMLHIDVMDGHFVPNISIGPVVIKSVRPCCQLYLDTHLMISDPLKYASAFSAAGSDGITFHLEAVRDAKSIITELRRLGLTVGVSIKPKTPIELLTPIIEQVDMVLLMSVEPGFGGQAFLPESIERCAVLRRMLRDDQRLEVDGGIDANTVEGIVKAGADTLVAGNAVFGQEDPAGAVRGILEAAGNSVA